MSKRIIRVQNHELAQKLHNVVGKAISVVRNSDHTDYGILAEVSAGSLLLKDGRDHIHAVKFTDITEVIYDEVSNW